MRFEVTSLSLVLGLAAGLSAAWADEPADTVLVEEHAFDAETLGRAVGSRPDAGSPSPDRVDTAVADSPTSFDPPMTTPEGVSISSGGATAVTNLEGSFGGATIVME